MKKKQIILIYGKKKTNQYNLPFEYKALGRK